MFAMLYTTGADALISVWSDKARWLFWRPITAIREADRRRQPRHGGRHDLAAADQHAAVSRSAVRPVGGQRRDGRVASRRSSGTACAFSVTSLSSNTTRSYRSFSQAVDEVVDARVYSGIHFRKADEDGAELGEDVARDGLERYFERD